jgi:adenylate kinase
MNILLLGPQGSGKGTQAQLLAHEFGLNYIEMGGIMRSIASSDNQYAKPVRDAMTKGQLVPDEFFRLVLWDQINKCDKTRGFIFDGFPRNFPQYEQLKDMLMRFGMKIDKVILIDISEAETIRRLTARRTCRKCGRVYNLITNPPKQNGKCECGGELYQREDDTPEATRIRLITYRELTMPVIEAARKEGILIEFYGEKPIEEINREIVNKLGLQKNG